ncbi:hypothetical protein M8C21_000559, partial [Ambrosia artemisiifolia]
ILSPTFHLQPPLKLSQPLLAIPHSTSRLEISQSREPPMAMMTEGVTASPVLCHSRQRCSEYGLVRLSDILIPVEYDVTEVFNVHRFTCSLTLSVAKLAVYIALNQDFEAELRSTDDEFQL